jgi:hypothetical protein
MRERALIFEFSGPRPGSFGASFRRDRCNGIPRGQSFGTVTSGRSGNSRSRPDLLARRTSSSLEGKLEAGEGVDACADDVAGLPTAMLQLTSASKIPPFGKNGMDFRDLEPTQTRTGRKLVDGPGEDLRRRTPSVLPQIQTPDTT